MRKMISFATALTLAAAMAAPMSVFADTITETSNPKSAETEVTFNVDPGYTVTIPATVKLAEGSDSIYTNSGTVSAEDVLLNEGKKIVVTLASVSEFNMVTPEAKDYELPYTATGAFGPVDKEKGGKVAEFGTKTGTQEVKVTFTTDETPTYAGKYSDTVVFTIAVADADAE